MILYNSLYLLDPWDSSNYKGMHIQDNAAESAGTMDSTVAAAAAEEQQSLSPMSETDRPRQTRIQKRPQYFYPRK